MQIFEKGQKTISWFITLSVGAFEVVVVGGGVDVTLVAQNVKYVVHLFACHPCTDL